jgi:hypothetical protein
MEWRGVFLKPETFCGWALLWLTGWSGRLTRVLLLRVGGGAALDFGFGDFASVDQGIDATA